jgi:hypothetical protein
MTLGLREGIKLGSIDDVYIPLDCDEFLTHITRQDFLNEINRIPKDHVGFHSWVTYIPISDNFGLEKNNSLRKCFKQKEKKDPFYGKIIIPFSIAPDIIINAGSHDAYFTSGGVVKVFLMSYFLAHFPVRDSQQIVKKTISALDGLIRKKNRGGDEGFHVYDTLKYIISEKFVISLLELQQMAYGYAEKTQIKDIVLGEHPIWVNDYELKYGNIIKTDQMKCLAEIIINLWKNPLSYSDFLELQKKLF